MDESTAVLVLVPVLPTGSGPGEPLNSEILVLHRNTANISSSGR